MTTCFFHGCSNHVFQGAWKCFFHFKRARCQVSECNRVVYARGHCVRHGGKRQCQVPNCKVNCRMGKFCARHGPPLRQCSLLNCTTQAHARGLCVKHGGGRRCKAAGCASHARVGPYCRQHIQQPQPDKTGVEILDTSIVNSLMNEICSVEVDITTHDEVDLVMDWSEVDRIILDMENV